MPAPKDPQKRDEWIARISKGKKGSISPNKGKKFNEKWRANLSSSHKDYVPTQKQLDTLRAYSSGKDNFNYIDGRDKNQKWRNWVKNKRNRLLRSKSPNTIGNHTYGEWETVKAQFNWTCPRCLKSEPEVSLTRDHIVPLSKGGSDNIENIQPLCLKCNLWKYTKIINFKSSIRKDFSL